MTTRGTLPVIVAFIALPAVAAPPTTCAQTDVYGKALCAYQMRHFDDAEAGFREIVGRGAKDAETLHATYFLARTEMKRGQWKAGSDLLIRIYGLDRAFYDTWSCDFLLGECRKGLGKE